MVKRTARAQGHLAELQVHPGYSFEAYEAFFPAWTGRNDGELNYTSTIANNPWLLSIRANVQTLIDAVQPEFTGLVTDDIGAIIKAEAEMRQFYDKIIKNRCSISPKSEPPSIDLRRD